MALVPANANLTTWLGTGAAITSPATASQPGYFIPRANVQALVGGDAVITDDIRDFLYSVLTLCADAYSQPKATADTRPTKVVVTKNIDSLSSPKKVIFTVSLDAATVVTTPDQITLPTFG